MSDQYFLAKTLKLAEKGLGWTFPNPMVGAVIVKNNQILASGYHRKAGFPHAEIEALNSLKTSLKNATLYVNLEPCSHFGKTPPCVGAIIASGITKVVCCTLDPNPSVAGKGVRELEQAGIKVEVGTLKNEAEILNEAFFTFHRKKRPFIALKFASSLDGKIATSDGNSKWITNEKARDFARKLRSQYQAVIIGINTVLKDNPHLGVRRNNKKDPLRIILDSTLKIPYDSSVLRDNNILIATTTKADQKKQKILQQRGVPLLIFEQNLIPLHKLLEELRKMEIISILVEGGGKVSGSFLDQQLIDKVYAFHAPILIGGEKAINAIDGEGIQTIADAIHLKNISYRKFDDNLLTIGYYNPI